MIGWFPDPRGVERQRKPARVGALEAQIEELNGTIESLHAELSDARRQQQWWAMVVIAQQVEIERLRGVEVKDDTRPRRGLDGLDMDKVSEAWDAELKRRGL
jgi:TolA-binding protein